MHRSHYAPKKVLGFSADIRPAPEKPVGFVFALSQIRDIIREVTSVAVPFSEPHLKGVARWRRKLLPVISLEEALGFSSVGTPATRLLILNTLRPERHAVILIRSGLRIMALPDAAPDARVRTWVPRSDRVLGAYDAGEEKWVVADMEKILAAGR